MPDYILILVDEGTEYAPRKCFEKEHTQEDLYKYLVSLRVHNLCEIKMKDDQHSYVVTSRREYQNTWEYNVRVLHVVELKVRRL